MSSTRKLCKANRDKLNSNQWGKSKQLERKSALIKQIYEDYDTLQSKLEYTYGYVEELPKNQKYAERLDTTHKHIESSLQSIYDSRESVEAAIFAAPHITELEQDPSTTTDSITKRVNRLISFQRDISRQLMSEHGDIIRYDGVARRTRFGFAESMSKLDRDNFSETNTKLFDAIKFYDNCGSFGPNNDVVVPRRTEDALKCHDNLLQLIVGCPYYWTELEALQGLHVPREILQQHKYYVKQEQERKNSGSKSSVSNSTEKKITTESSKTNNDRKFKNYSQLPKPGTFDHYLHNHFKENFKIEPGITPAIVGESMQLFDVIDMQENDGLPYDQIKSTGHLVCPTFDRFTDYLILCNMKLIVIDQDHDVVKTLSLADGDFKAKVFHHITSEPKWRKSTADAETRTVKYSKLDADDLSDYRFGAGYSVIDTATFDADADTELTLNELVQDLDSSNLVGNYHRCGAVVNNHFNLFSQMHVADKHISIDLPESLLESLEPTDYLVIAYDTKQYIFGTSLRQVIIDETKRCVGLEHNHACGNETILEFRPEILDERIEKLRLKRQPKKNKSTVESVDPPTEDTSESSGLYMKPNFDKNEPDNAGFWFSRLYHLMSDGDDDLMYENAENFFDEHFNEPEPEHGLQQNSNTESEMSSANTFRLRNQTPGLDGTKDWKRSCLEAEDTTPSGTNAFSELAEVCRLKLLDLLEEDQDHSDVSFGNVSSAFPIPDQIICQPKTHTSTNAQATKIAFSDPLEELVSRIE